MTIKEAAVENLTVMKNILDKLGVSFWIDGLWELRQAYMMKKVIGNM